MEPDNRPVWTSMLNDEDWSFIKRFILVSGSLKDLAAEYGISYPTVRGRLDRLIEKVRAADDSMKGDEFRSLIQSLVIDGQLMAHIAKDIIKTHEKTKK